MITIQQDLLESGAQPYPFRINPDGTIEPANVEGWPARLIGFQIHPDFQEINLYLSDFLAAPAKAVGMYPVFANSKGEWYGVSTAIKSVVIDGLSEALND